jgi:hypothetical protein
VRTSIRHSASSRCASASTSAIRAFASLQLGEPDLSLRLRANELRNPCFAGPKGQPRTASKFTWRISTSSLTQFMKT